MLDFRRLPSPVFDPSFPEQRSVIEPKGLPESGLPEGSGRSTIIGVPTALTPYPFPSFFFLLTSFSVCSLHGPHKLNATGPDEFFTCATRLEGTCKFSIDCNTVCSSKTSRFRGSHVKKRRIHASFWQFKNL